MNFCSRPCTCPVESPVYVCGHDCVCSETGDAGEAQPTQPIRGTQEWTESFVYDQSSSDYQRYRLHWNWNIVVKSVNLVPQRACMELARPTEAVERDTILTESQVYNRVYM